MRFEDCWKASILKPESLGLNRSMLLYAKGITVTNKVDLGSGVLSVVVVWIRAAGFIST